MNDYPLYQRNVFAVSPMSRRMSLEPGQSYTGTLKITNPTDAENDLHYKISVAPYSDVDDENTVSISDYSGIANWVTIDKPEGVVAPNNVALVNYTITVPNDAVGGGQYFAFLVQNVPSTAASSEGVQISDTIELSSIVYATVNGEVIYDGEASDITIPGFSFSNPITTSLTLTNTGNIHQDALIQISAKNAITGEAVSVWKTGENATSEDNEATTFKDSYIVLPGNTRVIQMSVSGLPDLGVFDLQETVSYNATEYTVGQVIVLCPVWLILLVSLLIAAMVGRIVFVVRRRHQLRDPSQTR